MFLKNPNDPSSKIFSTCLDCRNYDKIRSKENRNNRKSKIEEEKNKILESGETGFQICEYKGHKSINYIHEQNKVPIHLFRKDPDNPDSEILKCCYDCRLHQRNIEKRHEENKKKLQN